MTAVIFAYSGDALPLIECVSRLVALGIETWVFDDAGHPLPGNVQGKLWQLGAAYDRTTFERNRNLNGTECCKGMLRAMLSTGDDVFLKIDADTLLVNPSTFSGGNVGCHSTSQARRSAFGCCYSIRRETAQAVLSSFDAMPDDPTAPEDVAIWEAIRATGHEFTMIDHDAEQCGLAAVPMGAAVDRPGRFGALTFGNVPVGGWVDRGRQVFQEMRRFRLVIDEAEAIH